MSGPEFSKTSGFNRVFGPSCCWATTSALNILPFGVLAYNFHTVLGHLLNNSQVFSCQRKLQLDSLSSPENKSFNLPFGNILQKSWRLRHQRLRLIEFQKITISCLRTLVRFKSVWCDYTLVYIKLEMCQLNQCKHAFIICNANELTQEMYWFIYFLSWQVSFFKCINP